MMNYKGLDTLQRGIWGKDEGGRMKDERSGEGEWQSKNGVIARKERSD
jgi:hypothetical protein